MSTPGTRSGRPHSMRVLSARQQTPNLLSCSGIIKTAASKPDLLHMTNNPFQPPHAPLADPVEHQVADKTPWHTWVISSLAGVEGLFSIIISSLAGIQSKIGLGYIYLFCLHGFLWCLLAFVIYKRSQRAWIFALIAICLPKLIWPLEAYLINLFEGYHQEGLNYFAMLLEAIAHTPILERSLGLIVLAYCAWDYRQRFASWLRERPEPTPEGTDELERP